MNLLSLSAEQLPPPEPEPIEPSMVIADSSEAYARFIVEPLAQGFGTTLGNAMRRVLLNSLPGAAITAVQIGSVQHEYSTLPHVQEDMIDFLLNVKAIRMRALTGRPAVLRLELTGRTGPVRAKDLLPSGEYEIVNPELVLLHLDSPDADISMEFHAETGVGYQPAENRDGQVIGLLPVDALFTPIRRANFEVEATRVGQVTDYDRLILEVWTDNTITPQDAVQQSADIILQHLQPFASLGRTVKEEPPGISIPHAAVPDTLRSMTVEDLRLSSRTQNSLRRGNLATVGEVLQRSAEDLLNLRNFGDRSLEELVDKFRSLGIPIPEEGDDQPWRKAPIAALFDADEASAPAGVDEAAEVEDAEAAADTPTVYSSDQETAGDEEEVVNLGAFARRTFDPEDDD